MFPWYVPVGLKVLISNGLAMVLIKKITSLPSRTTKLTLQFLFCCLIALGFGVITNELEFSPIIGLIAMLGFFNGLAAYCQWQAIAINLSKNALFTFWDDIIAMSLAFIVIGEASFLNKWLYLGTAISLLAVILFTAYSYNRKYSEKSKKLTIDFLLYVGIYSVIWGVAVFMMRYWALHKIKSLIFLSGWYGGAFLAALFLLVLDHGKTKYQLCFKDVLRVFILSISIIMSLALAFWSYQVTPLTIAQPIFLVGEMIIPALIGLYYFKEIKELDQIEIFLFGLGILGGIVIAFNYHGS